MLPKEKQFAVFIDIDDTLILRNHEIPERNIKAIRMARNLGHKIFINTGRSLCNIPQSVIEESNVDGIVCGDGTVVVYHGEMFVGKVLTDEIIRRTAEYVSDNPEIICQFEGIKHCYFIKNSDWNGFGDDVPVKNIDDLFENIEANGDKIQVMFLSTKAEKSFIDEISDKVSIYMFDEFCDVVMKGCNKVQGIENVLEITGISKENTMAIGDSENDKSMLEFCKIGVAMGNSQQCLKEIADYITVPNYEGGVGEGIEKFLLS